MNRGIERETFRTDGSARLSLTPHPASLGNKLTHPSITTDFSESQLELITPVFQSVDALLNDLTTTHQFVARQLGKERLWPGSMPCILPDEQAIPLADYGLSSLGRLKSAYRNGLGLRYNRIMQTICAVHYNFSLATPTGMAFVTSNPGTRETAIRCSSILRSDAQFQAVVLVTALSFWRVTRSGSLIFNDEAAVVILPIRRGHLLLPFATSLRSGTLAIRAISSRITSICYNSLADYADSLRQAITTPMRTTTLSRTSWPSCTNQPAYPPVGGRVLHHCRAKTAAPR